MWTYSWRYSKQGQEVGIFKYWLDESCICKIVVHAFYSCIRLKSCINKPFNLVYLVISSDKHKKSKMLKHTIICSWIVDASDTTLHCSPLWKILNTMSSGRALVCLLGPLLFWRNNQHVFGLWCFSHDCPECIFVQQRWLLWSNFLKSNPYESLVSEGIPWIVWPTYQIL